MEAPKIPSFFKTKKPNQFFYEPRYYDERKERMEKRYASSLEKSRGEKFKTTLKENWKTSRTQKRKKIHTRVFLYILLLSFFAYYLLWK